MELIALRTQHKSVVDPKLKALLLVKLNVELNFTTANKKRKERRKICTFRIVWNRQQRGTRECFYQL